MADIHTVTPNFAVAPQIAAADVAAIARHGYVMIINNRPDHEQPGQPTAADMAAEAKAAGLAYRHIPFAGRPTPDQVAAVRSAIAEAGGPVLAHCRSGTRSITAWALGEQASGARSRDELLSLALAAGYDLAGVL